MCVIIDGDEPEIELEFLLLEMREERAAASDDEHPSLPASPLTPLS